MKTLLHRLTDRLLSALGLDLEFSISLRRDPFSEITPRLFLGGRPRAEDLSALKASGITHVVSCLPEADRSNMTFLTNDFEALFLPIHDGIHEDIAATFPDLFDFASQANTLFIHCQVGVSRSATLATALLMHAQRKRFYETVCEVRSKRPEILPNIGFASQLQKLELALFPNTGAELSSLARYLHQICNVPVEIEVLQSQLEQHNYDAYPAIRAIFGEDIPRVIQGVRV